MRSCEPENFNDHFTERFVNLNISLDISVRYFCENDESFTVDVSPTSQIQVGETFVDFAEFLQMAQHPSKVFHPDVPTEYFAGI